MHSLRVFTVCSALLLVPGIAAHGMNMDQDAQSRQDHQARVAQADADYAEAQAWARLHPGSSHGRHEADPVRDAQYMAMLEKCDASRQAKVRCVARAKRWYDKG